MNEHTGSSRTREHDDSAIVMIKQEPYVDVKISKWVGELGPAGGPSSGEAAVGGS